MNRLLKKIFTSYSVIAVQNYIFSLICKQCCINKVKLFKLMNHEIDHPSSDAINITWHLNLFNNIIKLCTIALLLLIIMAGGINIYIIFAGIVTLFTCLFYQYYIDKKMFNILSKWKTML